MRKLDNNDHVSINTPVDHIERRNGRDEEEAVGVKAHDDTSFAIEGTLDKGKGRDTSLITGMSIQVGNDGMVPTQLQPAGSLEFLRDSTSPDVPFAQQHDQNSTVQEHLGRDADYQQAGVSCLRSYIFRVLTIYDRFATLPSSYPVLSTRIRGHPL